MLVSSTLEPRNQQDSSGHSKDDLQFAMSRMPPLSASANATRWKVVISGICHCLRTVLGVGSLSSSDDVMFRMACMWSLQLSGFALSVASISPTVETRASVAVASIDTRSSKEWRLVADGSNWEQQKELTDTKEGREKRCWRLDSD